MNPSATLTSPTPEENDTPVTAPQRIGWACAYVPLEILHAAGLIPVRVTGNHSGSTPLADAFLHPGTCRFVAGYLESILNGEHPPLAGFIAADACVPARRVLDILVQNRTLPFLFQLNIPNTASEPAIGFFKGELRRLIRAIETFFGKTVTTQQLQTAIREMNAWRDLWRKTTRIRSLTPTTLDGTKALDLMLRTLKVTPGQGIEILERSLADHQNDASIEPEPPVRLVLTGSVLDDPSFISLIETCGGLVVAEDLCLGSVLYRDDVNQTDDPVHDLARHYLTRNACPTINPVENRLKQLADLGRTHQAEAVIHQHLSGCHLHNGMTPLIQKQLADQGLPVLHLTRDEGPQGRESLRTRIEAFFEMIRDNR